MDIMSFGITLNALVLLACIFNSWSLEYFPMNFKTTMTNKRLVELIQNIGVSSWNTIYEASFTSEIPEDCNQREKVKKQPIHNSSSHVQKCCPIGESITISDNGLQHCYSTNLSFSPNIISAILYENCIEDTELQMNLPYEIGNPCNKSFIFNNREDVFYVLQDGSLLIMDEYSNDSYSIETKYCLDIDKISGYLYAIVCITSVEEHLSRSQVLTVGILMLTSLPCLLVVSCLHLLVKELRTVHGLLLSLMALSLAVGFLLHSSAHIFNLESPSIGHAIQWFMLSYFCWILCLCCNVFLNIWFYIPHRIKLHKPRIYQCFAAYSTIACSVPTAFVLLTIQKGLLGMPSYFFQGFTESIRESQRYFIPPVSGVLCLSFIVMIISFFGLKKIRNQFEPMHGNEEGSYKSVNMVGTTHCDADIYEEVKKDAKCICFLLLITITTWLLEVVTFYSPGPENYLLLMEMLNGVQGIFILLIFVIVRRRRIIIIRWWHDRGSHPIESLELSETILK